MANPVARAAHAQQVPATALSVASSFARRNDPRLKRWFADLQQVAMHENWDALEVLVSFPHADVGAALALCASRGRHRELEKMLEKREGGASAGDWAETLGRAGRAAAARAECECVRVLMAHDMDVDDVLLSASCADGVEDDARASCVGLLLRGGADANCRNHHQGWKPLHAVAKRGDCASVELLVRGGADIDARYYNGKTALFSACEWGEAAAARTLLRLGASVEVGQWEADRLHTDHSLGANNAPVSPRDIALVNRHIDCVDVVDEMLALRRA